MLPGARYTVTRQQIVRIVLSLTLAACADREAKDSSVTAVRQPGAVDSIARVESTSGGEATGTAAAVDHSRMPAKVAAAPSPMAGMDHSKMDMSAGAAPPAAPRRATGRAPAPAAADPMAGMDHSAMNMGTPARAPSSRGSAAPPMAGMDHAAMPAVQERDPAEQKIRALVAMLVKDSVVLRRILADTILLNRWQDSTVRRLLLPPS